MNRQQSTLLYLIFLSDLKHGEEGNKVLFHLIQSKLHFVEVPLSQEFTIHLLHTSASLLGPFRCH